MSFTIRESFVNRVFRIEVLRYACDLRFMVRLEKYSVRSFKSVVKANLMFR
ncbi:hypothetical protein X947_5168 [Burkholderia pseudomallei MSHR7334]|nr:hypothetical protein DP43_4330 [Burkholderia pseudomallei]KGS76354.1 hypothetical protein X947_5168 [Burkholderia pseudomallei MSHR7334]KGW37764.1 hypothetical protein Y047_5905 [Burkholderia pseudomallei MSHR3016]